MVSRFLLFVGFVLVCLIAEWLHRPRLDKDKSIGWALWQLLLWFALGGVPTYLLGVICSTLKGYDGWSGGTAIGAGLSAGFGVTAFIAGPHVAVALGDSPASALNPRHPGRAPLLLFVALGLGLATLPLWWSNRLAQMATPEVRRGLVQQLKNPDESIRRECADLLGDFGTADEIPALDAARKRAQQSGDRELEQKCNRALERIRRR